MRFFLSILCLLVTPYSIANDAQNSSLNITEWHVEWEGRPRDPFVDTLGRTWFCGQAGNYIAYLQPETGVMKRYELPPDTHPHNLIVDPGGDVWYAGNRNAHIGKLNPENGDITRFPMPDQNVKDPHTLVFNQAGNIWFTAQWGNALGFLDAQSGKIELLKVNTPRARPYGIKMDSQDRPWVVLLGTNKLAMADPKTLNIKEISLPRKDARPRRLEITADGNIWYVDYAEGFLGRYTPDTETFKEWQLPEGSQSKPYGTALDKEQRLWIADTGVSPNQIVGFDTKQERFFYRTPVSSGGSVRHMYYHSVGHAFWYGTDSGYIGRAQIIETK